MNKYQVYLTAGDAVEDILRNPRFEGAVDSIAWLTSFIDQYFVIIISTVSFFIIGSAMLRNVIAGAYTSYPRFWDKVDAAHDAIQSKLQSKGTVGAVAATILGFLPNIKEISDFSDDTVAPTHYFLKAIPKMFALVMIGVFIYNGYYRDLTVKTSQFGSILFQRFILAVEPTEVLDRMVQNAYQPKVTAASGNDSRSKYVTRMSKNIFSMVMSKYNDVTDKASKDVIMSNIENAMWDFVNNGGDMKDGINRTDIFNDYVYKVNTEVYFSTRTPELSNVYAADTNDRFTAYYIFDAKTKLGISSNRDRDTTYYIVAKAAHDKLPEKAAKIDNKWDRGVEVKDTNYKSVGYAIKDPSLSQQQVQLS